MTVTDVVVRTARKRHRCGRQSYWDRLPVESRAYRSASQCPRGGWIESGEQYAETEGSDPFHPSRTHIDCEAFPHD